MDGSVAPQVIHHVKHIVPVVHSISQGYSMLYTLISSAVAAGVGFGLGWYIKGRGATGVQIDLNNIKNDVENLKSKVFPSAATPAPSVAA